MDLDTLIERLKIGESYNLEFKAAEDNFPNEAWKTISAFANTDGGYLILGVSEKRGQFFITGIINPDRQCKDFWDNHNNPQKINTPILNESDVSILRIDNKSLIIIKVPRVPRNQKPIYINRNPLLGTYKRQGEGDYLCSELEVKQMLRDANDEPQDGRFLENFTLDDIDREALKSFRNRFHSREQDHPFLEKDDLGLLEKLGGWRRDRLSGKEGLTLAGLLMFGKEQSILDAIPHYFLDYQERPTIDSTEWTYRLTSGDGRWEGNLFNFYYRIYNRLIIDLDVPFKLDENAVRMGETSVHKAIREAVANTLIHADHSSTQAITIVKHKDSFVFSNPGCLRISIEQLFTGGQSDPRNPNIQTMFRMIGLGERAGSGFPRIIQACQEQQWVGPVVPEESDSNRTTVILLMVSFIPEEVDRDLRQITGDDYCTLSELDRMILFFTHRLADISNNTIQQYSQKHPRDIGECLKRLVQKGYLEQSGRGRGTHYSLTKIQHNSDPLEPNSDPLEPNSDPLEPNSDPLEPNSDPFAHLKELALPVSSKGKVTENVMREVILHVCKENFLTASQLEVILNRAASTLRPKFLSPMVKENLLKLRYPETPNHPEQAYKAMTLLNPS
jgi:ATP-dependent DNA helicase RecG